MLKYILLGLHRFASLQHVPVLGVTLSSDLTMDKYVSNFCLADFYRLRQLRRVRRSLESRVNVASLVHAVITSRIDYSNVLLAGAPKATTDKL